MEKKKSENEEKSSSTVGLFVILDNVSSSRSWSPENWRLVHNQSRSVQTFRSFNQLISNHWKYQDPDRDHRKGVSKVLTSSSLLFFFLDTVKCEHARAASGEAARNEGWLIYFSSYNGLLVLVFLLPSVLFHNHQILMASLAFFFLKHCTLLPTTLEKGKINTWTYFYRKCPAENAGNGISETLN